MPVVFRKRFRQVESARNGAAMSSWWNRRRFDLIEMCFVGLVLVAGSWSLLRRPQAEHASPQYPQEAEQFLRLYGPSHTSQGVEEWIVRDFFKDTRDGFFIDVGANDYKFYSTTYYLETTLGWSGIAVEPQREFEGGYTAHRPRTRFRPFFVSDVSDQAARLYALEDDRMVTSATKEFTERYGKGVKEIQAPTITLTDLLDREHVRSVDFMSMDIELSEPKGLAGFDIDRFRPAFVCIEAAPEVRQQILDYFARHRYVVVGKYLRADTINLYFSPLQ